MMSAIKKIVYAGQPVTLIEQIQSDAMPVEWHLEPFASLTLIQTQELPLDANSIYDIRFILGQGSSLHYMPIMSGSGKSDISITITLADNAHAKVNGIYALNEQQQCSIQTRQYHHGIDSSSSLIINGSASDQSVLTYNGIIAVEKSASRTSASQENKTILFGDQAARAVSVPSLEVQTNDVQCAHGSAIGMLNVEHLRYAQSRGMDIEQAQRLLLTSFFAATL